MNVPSDRCPHCGRTVTETDALYCAGCGAPVRPVTVPVFESPPPVASPPPPAAAAALTAPPEPIDNRSAALLAFGAAALSLIGAFQVWLRITVGGFAPLGSDATGWQGGDGRTVVGAAVVGAVVAALLLRGWREMWLKVALFIVGGVTVVIATANIAAVRSKGHDVEVQFGLSAGSVKATAGIGVFMALIAGLGFLGAALRTRTATT